MYTVPLRVCRYEDDPHWASATLARVCVHRAEMKGEKPLATCLWFQLLSFLSAPGTLAWHQFQVSGVGRMRAWLMVRLTRERQVAVRRWWRGQQVVVQT